MLRGFPSALASVRSVPQGLCLLPRAMSDDELALPLGTFSDSDGTPTGRRSLDLDFAWVPGR